LFRFDGIRFQQYQPPSDPKFNPRKVCSPFATPDGGRPRVRDAKMFEHHSGGLATFIASTHGSILLRRILFFLPVSSLFLARKDDLTFAHQVREYEPGDVRGEGHLPVAGAAGANIMMVLGTVAL
jgi:hypothetical protein